MRIASLIPGTTSWRRRRDERICAETLHRVQEIVDGELPAGATEQTLRRHLEACTRCGREAEAVERLKRAIARATKAECDELSRRIDEIARRVAAEGGSAGG